MWQEKLRVIKTNKVAALYPGTKLLIVVLFSLSSFILASFRFDGYPLLVIAWFLVLPLLAAASGISKLFWRGMRAVFVIAGFILVVQSFFIPGDTVLWQLGFIKLYKDGLISGMSLSFAVMNVAGAFVWMFQCTENKEISAALDNTGLHYKATYTFLSSMQMIKVLQQNSRVIMNAQRARGVETQGNVIVRAKAFFPSLVPLILGSITGAEERVLTLESKGFDVNCKKTRLYKIERTPLDTPVVILTWAVFAAVLVWRILAWVL